MNATGHRTPREIFVAALRLAPEQWDDFLRGECGDDTTVHDRVRELLRAHADAGSFLDGPAVPADPAAPVEAPGTVIGPYKLLEQIGEGGMGLVFMAEQTEPIRRKVALKIIKPGMDTKQVVARFEAERQALALMEHPNIAKILDAGFTGSRESGIGSRGTEAGSREKNEQSSPTPYSLLPTPSSRPYFVMELVRGVPITEFCDQHRYTPRQRLALFITVCQAVQHAHQKGIIHRDLKPSNVLVTLHDTVAVPKIIDFGIAKAMEQSLTNQTLFTNFAQLIGTPQYMSPEQAEMNSLDIDTRSDVYSLGVLLYELLTGTTPFDSEKLKQAGFDEMRRLIREDDPPRPSHRISTLEAAALTTLSEQRGVDGRRFGQSLRGELDWVVMKALEKDRNRRYDSASALAADVQRYLDDEPILAKPPGWREKAAKWGRRHRGVAWSGGLASAAVLAMLGGTIGYLLNDRAARQVQTAKAVGVALQESERFQRQRKISQALDQARLAEAILRSGASTPDLDQRVQNRLADLELIAEMDQMREFRGGGQDDAAFAQAFRSIGIDVDSLPVQDAVAHIRERSVAAELAAVLDTWSSATRRPPGGPAELQWRRRREIALGADPDPVRNRLRQIVLDGNDPRKLKALLADTPPEELSPATVLAFTDAMDQQSEVGDTVRLLQSAVQRFPDDYWLNRELAFHLVGYRPADFDAPIRFYSIAVALRPNDVFSRYQIGYSLQLKGRHEEALSHYRECLRLNPIEPMVHERLGSALSELGLNAEAAEAYQRAIEIDPNDNAAHLGLGSALLKQGHLTDAERVIQKAIGLYEKWFEALNHRAASGRAGKVEETLIRSAALDPGLPWAHGKLGEVLSLQGRYRESLAAFEKCHELGSKLPEWTYPSAENLRAAQRMVALEAQLPTLLSGGGKPASAADQISLAAMCHTTAKKLYGAAARFYADAFAAEPTLAHDLNFEHRYHAACAAAMASCGHGEDAANLADTERARLRQKAHDWLTAELAAWAKVAEKPTDCPKVSQKLRHWQRDSDLVGVRDPTALAKLPEAERIAWQKLWADVAELLKRTEEPKAKQKSDGR